jgi:YggT family protein
MPSTILLVIRYTVFAAFLFAVLVALGSWLVRTRRLSPFGLAGRALRQVTDPVMRPVERRVVRAGGNPVQAGWWLVIGVTIVGVVVISLVQWALTSWDTLALAVQGGGRATLYLAIDVLFKVLIAAIFIRVIASWLGRFRYTWWLRPAYWLTDWIIEPIRRLLPPGGPIDWSPLLALLALWVLRRLVGGLF